MKDFLTVQEISVLEEAHTAAQRKKEADCIKTILLLNEGFSYKSIAHILRLDDTTVRRYFKKFKTEGIDGLLEDHYHGSLENLTKEQETELTEHLKTRLHQTAKEVALHIQAAYEVNYSIEGITHLLHLPAYSPNLNIIERLWKFFHQKHHDKYFEKFKVFEQEVLTFFKNIKQYDAELRTLLTDSFQTLPT